jgi:hypothetical protein
MFFIIITVTITIIAIIINAIIGIAFRSNLREFSLFCACPSNKHCPSARYAYAAKVVGKDLDIFALGADLL